MRSALALLVLPALAAPCLATVPQNVLLLVLDDLAPALGCYGDVLARTPSIDRLASTGICFERAYTQFPLCNPSRASVLTGLRPDQIRVYDHTRHFRDAQPDRIALPQRFRREGYFSARVGPVFQSHGEDKALDDSASWTVTINPKPREQPQTAQGRLPELSPAGSEPLEWLAAEAADEDLPDGLIASETIRLLEGRRDEPFFIAAGFAQPNPPFVAPKKYFELYPIDSIRLPYAPEDDQNDLPPAAVAGSRLPLPEGVSPGLPLQAVQAYYASVSFVDAQIGRVLSALERLDLVEKTIVVLWSDHGFHLGEHGGLWRSRSLFEQATRSPLIFRIPWLAANGTPCRQVVELVDIYPTLLDLAGIPPAGELAGRSLLPLLQNPLADWDGHAITQILLPAGNGLPQPTTGFSIRTSRWRFTEWDEGRAGLELYDHHSDPLEFQNLANRPGPEIQAVMDPLRQLLRSHGSRPAPPSSHRSRAR